MNNKEYNVNKVKLGTRLASIEAMVARRYDHIWDCCCDHGLLGFQLLENNKAQHIHFIDIVPNLLDDIAHKLKRYYQGEANWHVHCLDVGELPINDFPDEKHLVIIAGVGGQLLIELLTTLLPLTTSLNVEFIVSPVHHNYQLRKFLITQQCGLMDESIVTENKRFYELMHIKKNVTTEISLVGDKMWDFENPLHPVYLQQTISHYQRIAKNPKIEVSHIIKAYQDLLACV